METQTHNLQRDNTRLTQLIANMEGAVLVEDETRHITLVNQSFCDMFGIPAPPHALIGVDCSNSAEETKELFVDPDTFVRRIDTILAERQTVIGESLHMVDGRVLARDYIPVFDTDEYIGHLWHYHDVSEAATSRRRMERLLRFEEVNKEIIRLFLQLDDIDDALTTVVAMTGQLLDVSRVYIFRFRENERIVDNTHEWCAPGVKPEIDNLKGLPFDDMLPSFFPLIAESDLIAPRHISELPGDLRAILEPQDIQTILWMPMFLNGRIEGFVGYDETRYPRTWLPEEITMARILMESYARAIERDQAARMLIKARDEAVRTAQLRAQFVANMSHEIRTPMTGIMGMLELLSETELDEFQHEFTTEAFGSSTRLLAIINDILDFSKLEAGQIVLEAESIDLSAIATEVSMTLKTQLRDKSVEMIIDVDPDVPYRVYGDATRIRQVLMNLVSNAVKFTHDGHITISIEVVRQAKNVAHIRFAVKDSGVGIAPDQLDRIFESFVQADGSTTRKYGGSGLGLSISKQLAELMGGQIKVDSVHGTGSTFSFTLRLPIAQATSSDQDSLMDFSHLQVLLVDSNRTASYVMTQHLEGWGIKVTHVKDMSSVLTMNISQPFDLAFCRVTAQPGSESPIRLLSDFARQVCHITDSYTEVASDPSITVLRWPIDQSKLYNTLVEALPVTVNPPQETVYEMPTQSRILVADDYEVNIDIVERALANLPISVDVVENGQQALYQLGKNDYDLILMDIQMPVMDGIEATKIIRQSDTPYRNIPILALTASVMRDEQQLYLEIGMNAVISKPFSVRHLRQVVTDWLRQSAAISRG